MNNDSPKNVAQIAEFLEQAIKTHEDKELKAFLVYINPEAKAEEAFKKELAETGRKSKLEKVALTFLHEDKEREGAVKDYQINTDKRVKNTVFVYIDKKSTAKFVNLTADKKGLQELDKAVRETASKAPTKQAEK